MVQETYFAFNTHGHGNGVLLSDFHEENSSRMPPNYPKEMKA